MLDAGDLARFERTLLPHLDAAYSLARYIVRDPHDAEDAVQESYLRAARYFHTLHDDDGRAWLLAIVRRTCVTMTTERGTHPTISIDEPMLHLVDDHAAPDEDAFRTIARERVRHAMDQLSPELRETLVLRELGDCSYSDIATITNVAVGTVMSRLSRGRARMAVQLRSEVDDAGTA